MHTNHLQCCKLELTCSKYPMYTASYLMKNYLTNKLLCEMIKKIYIITIHEIAFIQQIIKQIVVIKGRYNHG